MKQDQVEVVGVRCTGDGYRRPATAAPRDRLELWLVRRGCFGYRNSSGGVLVDVTASVLTAPQVDYTVIHPRPGGDLGTALLFDEQLPATIAGGDLSGLPLVLPLTAAAERAHHRLVALTAGGGPPGAAQELAIQIVSGLLEQVQPDRVAFGRPRTAQTGRYLVDDARVVLSADPAVPLAGLAGQVGCSPHHLNRLFTQHTGAGIAVYRSAVRTAAVLDRLADSAASLAELAATGFADHAHLTRTIRRHFGITPSALRAELSARAIADPPD